MVFLETANDGGQVTTISPDKITAGKFAAGVGVKLLEGFPADVLGHAKDADQLRICHPEFASLVQISASCIGIARRSISANMSGALAAASSRRLAVPD